MDNSDNQTDSQQNSEIVNKYKSALMNTPDKRWSVKRIILIIIGVFVTFAVALAVILNISTSAPLKVSDELMAAIQANNSTAAYELLADDLKATVDTNDLAVIVKQYSELLTGKPEVKNKEISNGNSSSNSAKITYNITGSDNATYEFTVNLVQKNGVWKVLKIDNVKES